MQITDNVFVVTGGGNGIGREVVLALLARGGRVAAVDLSRDGLDETAELATTASTDRLSTHAVDITDRAAVEALPEQVREAHGRVTRWSTWPASSGRRTFADLDYPAMEKVLAVNLWGVIHTCKAFLPHLWCDATRASSTSREHGRPRAGSRADDVRGEQGGGQAVHRGSVRRAARHLGRRDGRLPRRRRPGITQHSGVSVPGMDAAPPTWPRA